MNLEPFRVIWDEQGLKLFCDSEIKTIITLGDDLRGGAPLRPAARVCLNVSHPPLLIQTQQRI